MQLLHSHDCIYAFLIVSTLLLINPVNQGTCLNGDFVISKLQGCISYMYMYACVWKKALATTLHIWFTIYEMHAWEYKSYLYTNTKAYHSCHFSTFLPLLHL